MSIRFPMLRSKLKVYRCKDDKDISDFIEKRNQNGDKLGWPTSELWYKNGENEEKVGRLYCGEPEAGKGFRMKLETY